MHLPQAVQPSFHHRQVQAPKAVGLQGSVKAERPALGSALPFHHPLLGTHRQTPSTAQSTRSSSPLLGIKGSPPAVPDKKQSVARLLLLKQEGQAA